MLQKETKEELEFDLLVSTLNNHLQGMPLYSLTAPMSKSLLHYH